MLKMYSGKGKPLVNLDGVMRTFQGCVILKDLSLTYLRVNDHALSYYGHSSQDLMIGKNDYQQHYPDSFADSFVYHDRCALKNMRIVVNTDQTNTIDGVVNDGISIKTPLYDRDSLVGTCTLFVILKDLDWHTIVNSFTQFSEYFSGINFHPFAELSRQLTPREYECLTLVISGLSAKEIAKHLHLSPRTVESHIENIKCKLDCHKRSDLFHIAKKMGIKPRVLEA